MGLAVPNAAGGAISVALATAAVVLLPEPGLRPAAARTLRRLTPGARRMVFAGAGLAGAGLLVGMQWWLAMGTAAAGAVAARRLPVRSPSPDTAELRRVALLLDLLATCMAAGMPVAQAISAVLDADAEARQDGSAAQGAAHREGGRAPTPSNMAFQQSVSGRAGVRPVLAEVAALLALGADPDSAWQVAAREPLLQPLAGAAVRSAVGGVRMGAAVRQHAADLRARCLTMSERSAARAGVAMTAPLALCFLPAFVCLGLAPVVIGLISSLHIW
jgi:hypothetical protein